MVFVASLVLSIFCDLLSLIYGLFMSSARSCHFICGVILLLVSKVFLLLASWLFLVLHFMF